MGDDDFRADRAVGDRRARRDGPDRARRRRRPGHGAQGEDGGQGRRGARCRGHAVPGARPVPGRAARGRQRARRPVLSAPEDDDDEGGRPDRVRTRGASVLRRGVRRACRRAHVGGGQCQRRARGDAEGDRSAARRAARSRPARDRRGVRERPGAGDGRLGSRHHEPPRAERRDHRRLDAGGDPLLGPDVEPGWRAAGHEVRDPRPLLRGAVRRDARGLPPARRVRPGHDGQHPEHRVDGPGGRGVRLARQDIRAREARVRCAS